MLASAAKPGSRILTGMLLVAGTACGFSISAQPGQPDAPPSDTPPIDAPPIEEYRATLAILRSGSKVLAVHAFDAEAGVLSACTEQPAPGVLAMRALLGHPTLDVAYGVDSGFHAFTLRCDGVSVAGMTNVGGARAVQRIVLDAAKGIGFFTGDGAGATGIYRFTVSNDGAPTLAGSGPATTQAGAMALDAATSSLYVAGPSHVSYHALSGASLDLPATRTNSPGCGAPRDLIVTSTSVWEFCSEITQIRRYNRSPFAFSNAVSGFGTTSHAISLPGGRAIAARISPPDLALVDLVDPTPTWSSVATLPAAAQSIAVSPDGRFVVTSVPTSAATSQIATWRLDGDSVELLDTQDVEGSVTAVGVTGPRIP